MHKSFGNFAFASDVSEWNNNILGLNVSVGREHDIKGRFHKYFNDLLHITVEGNILFADFKCVQSTLTGTPDVILKDDDHVLKVVGELKDTVREERLRDGASYPKTRGQDKHDSLWVFFTDVDEFTFLRIDCEIKGGDLKERSEAAGQ
ncbi:hypothetical protein DTO169E5_1108 [Paecilomyces variotii]|nr:hypothetical protein DTO169E5_1108 [Paecilomyces variotii]